MSMECKNCGKLEIETIESKTHSNVCCCCASKLYKEKNYHTLHQEDGQTINVLCRQMSVGDMMNSIYGDGTMPKKNISNSTSQLEKGPYEYTCAKDQELVMSQTKCTLKESFDALLKYKGDIVNAIIEIEFNK